MMNDVKKLLLTLGLLFLLVQLITLILGSVDVLPIG